MTFPKLLLAKSLDSTETVPESTTLCGHHQDCWDSSNTIMKMVGAKMLHALGLDVDTWSSRLKKITSLSAALHDIGKANNHFQKSVHGLADPEDRQPIRHEWISVWIAMQPEVKAWLMPALDGCEKCWFVMLSAIGGHHRKNPPCDGDFKTDLILVMNDHPNFQSCLKQIHQWFELDNNIPVIDSVVCGGVGDQLRADEFQRQIRDLRRQWKRLKRDDEWKKFCAIAKAALIGADVAASALWERIDESRDRLDWIESSLGRTATQAELEGIVRMRLGNDKPHEFQRKVEKSNASVTLVEAGCGSGKTAAAYMWAAKQHVGRRLWFCYPTTGTATEGFRGYLFDKLPGGSKTRTDLFHSRRQYDIQMMLENKVKEADDSFDPTDATVRIESLKAWDTQIVSCTVDNVLNILQNQRTGIYAWPALANSVIVFDEIHCYDEVLFGNLLAWLETLVGIPVLLMTASLPVSKREAIIRVCEESNRTLTHIPNGPPEFESLLRYQNQTGIADVETAIERVEKELEISGRVLWISNTVERTRNVGQNFVDHQPIYYHSRYIYKHRFEQHTEVVSLFEKENQSGFASTSQVAEMSLDLGYATLLITELAPIPALIQRLGRLNRRANPKVDPPKIENFIVIEPTRDGEFAPAPYEEQELELARQWLQRLGEKPISQADLIRHWHDLDEAADIAVVKIGWLEGGINTPVDTIRKSGYGITVICKRHLNAAKREGAATYALPMDRPKRDQWQATEYRFRGFPIASDEAIEYDYEQPGSEKKGAKWATHNQF